MKHDMFRGNSTVVTSRFWVTRRVNAKGAVMFNVDQP